MTEHGEIEHGTALQPEASRSDALLLLETDPDTSARYPDAAAVATEEALTLGDEGGLPRVVTERHRMASRLAASAQRARGELPRDRFWDVATHPVFGPLLLTAMLGGSSYHELREVADREHRCRDAAHGETEQREAGVTAGADRCTATRKTTNARDSSTAGYIHRKSRGTREAASSYGYEKHPDTQKARR